MDPHMFDGLERWIVAGVVCMGIVVLGSAVAAVSCAVWAWHHVTLVIR